MGFSTVAADEKHPGPQVFQSRGSKGGVIEGGVAPT